jgi:HK97 gp10 family phage protein
MAVEIRFDERALDELFASPDGPTGRFLTKIAIMITGAAKQLAPVDTGRLRASIDWSLRRETLDLVATVGSDVKYAVYAELGTSKWEGQPFLVPALFQTITKVRASGR